MASNVPDHFTINVPPNPNETKNPGNVFLRRIEKVNGIFMVTFAWIDMLGVFHEQSFERGDFFTDFNKILKVMTDTGLPIDPTKVEEFRLSLCKLSTFVLQQNSGKQQNPPPANQENKQPTTEGSKPTVGFGGFKENMQ